jgi:hypothetical protein
MALCLLLALFAAQRLGSAWCQHQLAVVKMLAKKRLQRDHPLNIAGFAGKVKFTVKTLMRRDGILL